jgi:hypothetical protein
VFAVNESKNNDTYGIVQENVYVEGDALKSRDATTVYANLNKLDVTGNYFSTNIIIDNKMYNLSYSIFNGNLIVKDNKIGKYDILSVYLDNEVFEMILKEKRNIIVITDYSHGAMLNHSINYNQDWYNDYITAEMNNFEITPLLRGNSSITNYDKITSRSFNIFGDVWTEQITVNIHNDWPSQVSQPADFNTSLTLKSNKTTITKSYGSSTVRSGSSLKVVGATAHFATDSGQYFESIQQRFSAKKIGTTKVNIGFWLGIPKTPFGITTTYEEAGVISAQDSGYQSFHMYNTGQERCVNSRAKFDSYSIHLISEGQYYKAIPRVQTYSGSGQKGLKVKWEWTISTSGNNSGTATPSYFSEDKSFNNTLYYTVY